MCINFSAPSSAHYLTYFPIYLSRYTMELHDNNKKTQEHSNYSTFRHSDASRDFCFLMISSVVLDPSIAPHLTYRLLITLITRTIYIYQNLSLRRSDGVPQVLRRHIMGCLCLSSASYSAPFFNSASHAFPNDNLSYRNHVMPSCVLKLRPWCIVPSVLLILLSRVAPFLYPGPIFHT